HTGGTLDKLEAIPGFTVNLDESRFRAVLRECGLALIGQTERLAPADKRLYALRDVTGTVESIPLIAASIMSKKLAEGIDGLVLGGAAKSADEGRSRIARALADGSALDRFRRCVALQGGAIPDSEHRWFPAAHEKVDAGAGFVQHIDAEAVGMAALRLGAGRTRKEDAIDPGAWVRLMAKVGEKVERGHHVAFFSQPRD